MALPTSGTLSHSAIQTEFGGSHPIRMTEYYGADHYNGLPSSGTITANDFFGKSRRTAKITCGRSSDSIYRYGYSITGGSSYFEPETGESQVAFGSITRNTYILSAIQTLSAVVMEPYGGNDSHLVIAQLSSSNSGWSTCYFKNYQGTVKSVNRTAADGFIQLAKANYSGGNYAYGWKWETQSGVQIICDWLKDGYDNNRPIYILVT